MKKRTINIFPILLVFLLLLVGCRDSGQESRAEWDQEAGILTVDSVRYRKDETLVSIGDGLQRWRYGAVCHRADRQRRGARRPGDPSGLRQRDGAAASLWVWGRLFPLARCPMRSGSRRICWTSCPAPDGGKGLLRGPHGRAAHPAAGSV